jgi:hypothetical protein
MTRHQPSISSRLTYSRTVSQSRALMGSKPLRTLMLETYRSRPRSECYAVEDECAYSLA